MRRKSWEEYFFDMVNVVATRSTCLRRRVGAVVVKGRQVVSTGYNGAPSRARHCRPETCVRAMSGIPSGQQLDLCRGSHAEMNAIAQAARHGISIQGGTIYTTLPPCGTCAKLIINAGLQRVVVGPEVYGDSLGLALLEESEVEVLIKTF